MQYTAIKKTFDNYENDKRGNFGPYICYTLLVNESVIGEFFYKNTFSYFVIDDNEYRIRTQCPMFGKRIYPIIKCNTGSQIAVLKISSWRTTLKEIGKLIYEDQIYTYKRSLAKVINAPLFSLKSRVAVNFFIENKEDIISYRTIYDRFFYDSDDLYHADDVRLEIHSSTDKMVLLYAGLFLMEKFWRALNF